MKRLGQSLFALLIVSALCACGRSLVASPSAGPIPEQALTSIARWALPSHPDLRKSWVSPELATVKSAVLFVSDSGTADVYIYRLPTLKVLARISGFSQPQGECSDNKGNVWIADTNANAVYEVSHSGHLENVLTSNYGHPEACAWDPTTGNLAVMTLFSGSGASGAVLVYRKGSGPSTQYTNPKQVYYNFGGYEDGNLFFDGRDANGTFMISELPKGAKSAHTIALRGGTIYFPGMVQWDSTASDLIVGDQACGNTYTSCLYSVKVASKSGTITGTTNLQSPSGSEVCDLVQGVEFDGEIAGSDNDFCGSSPSTTDLWPYPAGGYPTNHNDSADVTPVGATISQ
ncbi:MAG: hypothetical protein WAM02_00060 [Candidatus Cybelea sp.]